MSQLQFILIVLFLCINIFLFFKGLHHCQRKNSFGLTRWLGWLGMFVWGDVVVLSVFWVIASVICLLLQDVLLFLLIVSVFWLVRSLGETMYWFLQQFALVKRDPPESLKGFGLVKNEAIWFMYQVMWQCITVVSIIATLYLGQLWLHHWSA